jgi:hypothetical protein
MQLLFCIFFYYRPSISFPIFTMKTAQKPMEVYIMPL